MFLIEYFKHNNKYSSLELNLDRNSSVIDYSENKCYKKYGFQLFGTCAFWFIFPILVRDIAKPKGILTKRVCYTLQGKHNNVGF